MIELLKKLRALLDASKIASAFKQPAIAKEAAAVSYDLLCKMAERIITLETKIKELEQCTPKK